VYKRHAGGYVGGPSNALLAAFASYSQLVPAFERALAEANGDLNVFYARVRALSKLDKAERMRQLDAQVSGTSTTLR
jgi:predicted aminopeptidase